jgi:hypothetical protein
MAWRLVWFDLSCVVSKSWFDVRCVVLNFLSDTSCGPTVGVNMNGLFYRSHCTSKQPRKPLCADANFNLKTCHKRQSPQYKLKEETVFYLLIYLYGGGCTG